MDLKATRRTVPRINPTVNQACEKEDERKQSFEQNEGHNSFISSFRFRQFLPDFVQNIFQQKERTESEQGYRNVEYADDEKQKQCCCAHWYWLRLEKNFHDMH